jgi:hypothetical protein
MPEGRNREVRVRAVRKDKPDVRALARVLIELAIAESAQEQESADDTATKESA